MKSPDEQAGPIMNQWQGLIRNSPTPSDKMAKLAVRLIHAYDEQGIPRFHFRLPMFPGDRSYDAAPDETGALPPSTAQVLGFTQESFAQVIQ